MLTRKNKNLLICLNEPRSSIAEAYRTLRSNIQFAGYNKNMQTLLVTSADPGEGKTTTITNLAIVMAQGNQKVLLIDADMRKPSVHLNLPVTNDLGLSNLLIKQVCLEEVIQHVPTAGIDVITSGSIPPNPAELLNSKQMSEILWHATQNYDCVLIDSPPLLPVTDAQVLSRFVDGVLLVINSGKVLGDHVKKAKGLLEKAGATIIGTILNNKKMAKDHYYL